MHREFFPLSGAFERSLEHAEFNFDVILIEVDGSRDQKGPSFEGPLEL